MPNEGMAFSGTRSDCFAPTPGVIDTRITNRTQAVDDAEVERESFGIRAIAQVMRLVNMATSALQC